MEPEPLMDFFLGGVVFVEHREMITVQVVEVGRGEMMLTVLR